MTIVVSGRSIVLQSGVRPPIEENIPDGLGTVLVTIKYRTAATPTFWPGAVTTFSCEARDMVNVRAGAAVGVAPT